MPGKPCSTKIYDTVIIGGGPAGLAAALYLGRALRTVLVIDAEAPGRSDWMQVNHNFLGFPDGIPMRDLARRGREQAERYGAQFIDARATSIQQESTTLFKVRVGRRVYRGRTLIIATGVTDHWVEFPGSEAFIGRSMHWCIVCDGYEMQGKRVLVVGNDAGAVVEAQQLRHFSSDVALLLEPDEHDVSPAQILQLRSEGIAIYLGRIASARSSEPGMVSSIVTELGEEIAVDHIFSLLGSSPNADLAAQLNLAMNGDGFIQVDTEARTSLRGVFATGDVTRLFSHQVLTAAHEGATAAMAIASDLWSLDHPQG